VFPKKLFVCLLLVSAEFARAHDPFEGTSTIRLRTNSIDLDVTLNGNTAALVSEDTDIAGKRFDPAAFDENLSIFRNSGAHLYKIYLDDKQLTAFQTNVFPGKEEDVEYRLRYPRSPGTIRVEAVYLKILPAEGYGAMLTALDMVNNSVIGQKLLRYDDFAFEIPGAPLAAATNSTMESKSTSTAPPPPVSLPSFSDFFKLGIEHILTGFDHLLFLCGLLVVCRRLGQVAVIITAFTVAHSITLALAALNVASISSRIVEPAIAATIVFVGIENLSHRLKPERRWAVAFVFGLIHGFGFASALRAVGLGANGTPLMMPLFSFNLGIEVGQLAVAVIFLVLWRVLMMWKPFSRFGKTIVSLAIALIGTFWLIQRVFF